MRYPPIVLAGYVQSKYAGGGDPKAQQCGWLTDKFGEVVPTIVDRMLLDPDPARALRGAAAIMTMKKIDIEALRRAADGN